MYKILFFVTALCAIYCEANFIPVIIWDKSFQIPSQELIRAKRQLFGGGSFFPGSRPNHYFGGGGPLFTTPNHRVSAFGVQSQNKWNRPITYGGGVDWTAPRGGLSLSGSHTPHQTSLFTAAGNANILKTPDHNVNIFGSHTRKLGKFEPLSISTTGGVGYQHKSGGFLTLSGTRTSAVPNSASLFPSGSQSQRKTTSVTAEGGASIFKTPDHNVNVKASHTREYDENSKLLGSSTTGEVDYQHKSGGALKLSGTHKPTVPHSPLDLSGSQSPRETTSFTAEGRASIFKTSDHNVNVKASHTREYDEHFKLLGSSTSGGVEYQHTSGLSLKLDGIKKPNTPISGSLKGNMPVYRSKDGDTNVEIQGGLNFGGGKKPTSEVNVLVEKKF